MLEDNERTAIVDQKFKYKSNVSNEIYKSHLFTRIAAVEVRFVNVNFSFCIFDSAYIRNCTFDGCIFTGCKFLDSNLVGSSFIECDFEYATFERTHVDNDILESDFPGRENIRLKFARSLRMNYKEIGDAKSVNRAIGIELQATEVHLKKTWLSKKHYYRSKYKGFLRLKQFLEWVEFKVLDLIWGNGESALKLFRFSLFVMISITLVDVLNSVNSNKVSEYVDIFFRSPQVLLGIEKPSFDQSWYATLILFIRLVLFAFFMSIIIKRFNRR